MNFRIRKRNPAYKTSRPIKPIISDFYIILDEKQEFGFRLASNGSYWSSENHLKYGDFNFIMSTMKLVEIKECDDLDLPNEDELKEFVDQLLCDRGYYLEAGEDDGQWHPYYIYDELKHMEDI